jgi:hypothetical protein
MKVRWFCRVDPGARYARQPGLVEEQELVEEVLFWLRSLAVLHGHRSSYLWSTLCEGFEQSPGGFSCRLLIIDNSAHSIRKLPNAMSDSAGEKAVRCYANG